MHGRSVLAGLLIAALIAAGCSQGHKTVASGSANEAAAFAQSVLIRPEELPGAGWAVRPSEALPQAAGSEASPAACAGGSGPGAAPLGTGAVQLERLPLDTRAPLDVNLTVGVFRGLKDAESALTYARIGAAADAYSRCLEQAVRSRAGGDLSVSAKQVRPFGETPEGGVATAVEITLTDPANPYDPPIYRLESYVWRYENVLVAVDVTGLRKNLTPDLVLTAITAVQGHVEVRASGKR